jgi:hypothetical protein
MSDAIQDDLRERFARAANGNQGDQRSWRLSGADGAEPRLRVVAALGQTLRTVWCLTEPSVDAVCTKLVDSLMAAPSRPVRADVVREVTNELQVLVYVAVTPLDDGLTVEAPTLALIDCAVARRD